MGILLSHKWLILQEMLVFDFILVLRYKPTNTSSEYLLLTVLNVICFLLNGNEIDLNDVSIAFYYSEIIVIKNQPS